jgi:hypothetical protein
LESCAGVATLGLIVLVPFLAALVVVALAVTPVIAPELNRGDRFGSAPGHQLRKGGDASGHRQHGERDQEPLKRHPT